MDKPPMEDQSEDRAETRADSGGSGSEIEKYRQGIDDTDREIIRLINRRLTFAQAIGKLKEKKGAAVLDKAREHRVLERLARINSGPLKTNALRHIYSEIIAAAREVQSPLHIAYLGPEATFTHIAALHHFGHSTDLIPKISIRDVFSEVEKNACQYGVVPVENSIEGAVNHTLDLFFESDLTICAEKYLTISHDLLTKAEKLSDISVIYSHPQAFAQCRIWLRREIPGAALKETGSTARAAQMAAEEPGAAAIASREAANLYGLKVMAAGIGDVARNVTRFLVISHDKVKRTGADKTSILFVTAHAPGALYKALGPIAELDINMVKLESRPTKHENWKYCFFVDLEGHMDDPAISETIDRMKPFCLYLKWLGSYPMAPQEVPDNPNERLTIPGFEAEE